MRAVKTTLVIMLVIAGVILMARAASADEFKLNLSGATYTKWLWGNMRGDGSMYNFTTVPGEGYGDNGQGSELELFVDAKVSKKVSVHARIHSRFSQNDSTNIRACCLTAPTMIFESAPTASVCPSITLSL